MAPSKPNGEGSSATLRHRLSSLACPTPNFKEVAAMPEAIGEGAGLVATGGDPTSSAATVERRLLSRCQGHGFRQRELVQR